MAGDLLDPPANCQTIEAGGDPTWTRHNRPYPVPSSQQRQRHRATVLRAQSLHSTENDVRPSDTSDTPGEAGPVQYLARSRLKAWWGC